MGAGWRRVERVRVGEQEGECEHRKERCILATQTCKGLRLRLAGSPLR